MGRSLSKRLELLAQLVAQTKGRIPTELTARAGRLEASADQRLRLGEQTVVALAGATGSGKSSLFNALAQEQLAVEGVRRPTTSQPLAVSFGPTNTDLLDWLEIERRREVPPSGNGLTDLVLLDLPDHDSTEASHRAEVDRLVRVVDQFVFVLDPQKYADAAIHQLYLRPLAQHREVITVVLNQADRLTAEQLKACLEDLRRRLDQDGLAGVKLLATSAKQGAGVAELRDQLARLAAAKSAARNRLGADLDLLVTDFEQAIGQGKASQPSKQAVAELNQSLEAAAGVPLVVDAVKQAMVHRGTLATGWPLLKWLAKFRPDPLRRLRLGGGSRAKELPTVTEHSSLPARSPIAAARLKTGLRALASQSAAELPGQWQQAVSQAVHQNLATLPDSLDRAIVSADLKVDRPPAWWQLLRALQWILIAAVVIGGLWLAANFALSYLQLPSLFLVPIDLGGGWRIPLPTILLLGGLAAGLLLSVTARIFVGLGAKAAAKRAKRILSQSVAEVGKSEVLAPLAAELASYSAAGKLVQQLR